jgi:2-dehydropantoate 2-reductase
MKLAIIGLGGVGGFLGARLARGFAGGKDGVEVFFVARGEHLAKIRQAGLQYISPTEQFTVQPAAATDRPAELGPLDVVLFCLKTYQLDESAAQLGENVTPRTVVITVMNGVDNAARLKAIFPQAQVLDGGIYISAERAGPGVIRHIGGPGRIFFGAEAGDHQRYRPLAALFQSAGIPAEYREDIRWAAWEKYLFIAPLASATTYLAKTFGEMQADPAAWNLLDGLLSEVEAVARAQGIELPADIHSKTLARIPAFPPATRTSMQVDYARGRPLEIESLTGYVVHTAHELGIPVPLHDWLYPKLSK